MTERTVIAQHPNMRLEIIHRDSDPTVWRLECSKKVMGFKRRTAAFHFQDRQQAVDFAEEMKYNFLHPPQTMR
ncbi:MAG: hypothetical protein KGJ59_11805 [Bacteroidota bacterium]|nr:hypothetical protein [Bacteroidota bacterium]